MARTVLKFGGTSVADLERISHVADIVAHRAAKGEQIAVIVSAMSGETNKLVDLAKGAAGQHVIGDQFNDEYDVIVSSGEQVTSGLLALSLRTRGLRARSWLGWQMQMKTREGHGSARIDGFDEDSGLGAAIDSGEVAVIAGLCPAIFIRMWTAFTQPTRGLCRRQRALKKFRMKKCWKWRPLAPKSCKPVR